MTFNYRAIVCAACSACLLLFSGCGESPSPSNSLPACNEGVFCHELEGQAVCLEGYRWQDADDPNNFACVPIEQQDSTPVSTPSELPNDNPGTVDDNPNPTPPVNAGPVIFGDGTHSITNMDIQVVLTAADGLKQPRDVAFNPTAEGELWIVNQADQSMLIVQNALSQSPRAMHRKGRGGEHFLAAPIALAFGTDGTMATIHATADYTQGPPPFGTPKDFMGPTLWPANARDFDGGHASHMDMLHNSPLGMGIAWEAERIYWVFDGYHSSITRYDFNDDHGMGGTYHGDGVVQRYAEGKVKRVAGVPSHMVFDAATRRLFIADTGNNRIAVLDVDSGKPGRSIGPNYDGGVQRYRNDADIRTWAKGSTHGMRQPSGLALHEGILYVTDAETSQIIAFDATNGQKLDYLKMERSPGSLKGLEIGPDGNIYIVDGARQELLRIKL